MLGNVAKVLVVVGLVIVGFAAFGLKIYGAIGAVCVFVSMILLTDTSSRLEAREKFRLGGENPPLELLWMLGFSIVVGIFWPAIPVLATFESGPKEISGVRTSSQPDPSDERRKSSGE